MTNTCTFKGNLTKDAQFTVTPNGKKVYKISVATSTGKPKMENGEVVKNGDKTVYEIMYVDFVAFGKAAETLVNGSLHPMLAKGAFVEVGARFDGVNTYNNRDGQPAASANFVIMNAYDVSLKGLSNNKREDGATYQPKQSANNSNFNYGNQNMNQQSSFNNGSQQFNGGQQNYNDNQNYGNQQFGGQNNFGGQQQFNGNGNSFNPNGDMPF